MLDHHLQRSIVYRLALSRALRFSELKPDDIENKLFDYHLKKVVSGGFVRKAVDGRYTLTPRGRKLGVHVLENPQSLVDRAYSVIFMVVRSTEGDWLLYTRRTHPLRGKTGFMHAIPTANETNDNTASATLKELTGLDGNFKAIGGGFLRVFEGVELESFTHFSLLICENATGTLASTDKHATYSWVSDPDFKSLDMLPSMAMLVEKYTQGKTFYIEETYKLEAI